MIEINYATNADLTVWRMFDQQISEKELLIKIANKRCYILTVDSMPVGVMRYNLFWDSIPFLTLIFLDDSIRGKGYGKKALLHWESEMRSFGYSTVMTSSQSDEAAQIFYRKLGYKDAGCLFLNTRALAQPAEIFFIKEL